MTKARDCRGVVIAVKTEQVSSWIENEIADKCFVLYSQDHIFSNFLIVTLSNLLLFFKLNSFRQVMKKTSKYENTAQFWAHFHILYSAANLK